MTGRRRNPIDRLGDAFGRLVIVLSVLIVLAATGQQP